MGYSSRKEYDAALLELDSMLANMGPHRRQGHRQRAGGTAHRRQGAGPQHH